MHQTQSDGNEKYPNFKKEILVVFSYVPQIPSETSFECWEVLLIQRCR